MVMSEIQRLICTGSLYMRSTACMLQKAVLRPDSAVVVCCGLLAEWLKVRVRVRVSAGARECTSCTFFVCFVVVVFFWFISVVNLVFVSLVYTVFVSACDVLFIYV